MCSRANNCFAEHFNNLFLTTWMVRLVRFRSLPISHSGRPHTDCHTLPPVSMQTSSQPSIPSGCHPYEAKCHALYGLVIAIWEGDRLLLLLLLARWCNQLLAVDHCPLKWELLKAPHFLCGKGTANIEMLLFQAVAPIIIAQKPLFLQRTRSSCPCCCCCFWRWRGGRLSWGRLSRGRVCRGRLGICLELS